VKLGLLSLWILFVLVAIPYSVPNWQKKIKKTFNKCITLLCWNDVNTLRTAHELTRFMPLNMADRSRVTSFVEHGKLQHTITRCNTL
jgi:hypothetical protein